MQGYFTRHTPTVFERMQDNFMKVLRVFDVIPDFRSDYEIVSNKDGEPLVIRDLDKGGRSVTNDAREVVADLMKAGLLPIGRRLFYYDSTNRLDEITRNHVGQFSGFKAIR